MWCERKSIMLVNQEFCVNGKVRDRAVLNRDEWGSNPHPYGLRLIQVGEVCVYTSMRLCAYASMFMIEVNLV